MSSVAIEMKSEPLVAQFGSHAPNEKSRIHTRLRLYLNPWRFWGQMLSQKENSTRYSIFYLQDLASDFHKFYNDSKILVEDVWTKNKRLLIVFGVARILKSNLELLGINAPEKM